MLLGDIAHSIGGELQGNADITISGVSPIESAGDADISFVLESKFAALATKSNAAAFITFKKIDTIATQIVVKNPKKALATLLDLFYPPTNPEWHISDKTDISQNAVIKDPVSIGAFVSIGDHSFIGERTIIHPNVTIGKHCKVGENCTIFPGAVLYDNVQIGNNVTIHSNASIGIDGFGYYRDNNKWQKVPHVGKVIIHDNCDIGANTCIARGCIGDTVINTDTKIDTLNHFAHNTEIGEDCAMASHIAFAGSVSVGDHTVIGGQSGFSQHVKVGKNCQILARSGVTKNISDNQTVSGFPAQNHRDEHHHQAILKRLSKQHKQKN